jgi:hypothetical protein
MIVEALLLSLAAAAPAEPPPVVTAPFASLAFLPPPSYRPEDRAVSNWRLESGLATAVPPASALARLFGGGDGDPPRCVKLNNYWCVKRAGWNGEIAADAEGHVAFSSALEGAAVAALLLRRYYVDLKKHSARAVVARWAPANCFPMAPLVAGGGASGPPISRAGMARMMPQRPTQMGVAPHGLQNTLRARWLATYGRGGGPGWTVSALAQKSFKPLNLMRTPTIAEGMGEPASPPPRAADPIGALAARAAAPMALASCPLELARIENYAARIAAGVAKDADDDLRLFSPTGEPTENLAKVMANMAAVEIGPEKASDALIGAAVAQLRQTIAAQPK